MREQKFEWHWQMCKNKTCLATSPTCRAKACNQFGTFSWCEPSCKQLWNSEHIGINSICNWETGSPFLDFICRYWKLRCLLMSFITEMKSKVSLLIVFMWCVFVSLSRLICDTWLMSIPYSGCVWCGRLRALSWKQSGMATKYAECW